MTWTKSNRENKLKHRWHCIPVILAATKTALGPWENSAPVSQC